MHPLIETRRSQVAELCRRFHVQRLEVFGSAVGGDFDPDRSDVDLLVEFEPDSPLPALDQYFGLKEALEALLERPVDLVMASAVKNPYILKSMEETRENLYAACGVTQRRTSGTPAEPSMPSRYSPVAGPGRTSKKT